MRIGPGRWPGLPPVASRAPTRLSPGTGRAPRGGGGGGARRGVGGEEEREPVPTLLLPPSAPPPSRDSTSHHLLSPGPGGSPEPGCPALPDRPPRGSRFPSPPLLLSSGPPAPGSFLPRSPLSKPGLPRALALTSARRPGSPALPGLKAPGPAAPPGSPLLPCSTFPSSRPSSPRIRSPARPGSLPPVSPPPNPTPVSPSLGRRRPRERGAGREGGGAGDRESSRAEGRRRVREETGRGEEGETGERAPPTTQTPGAAPDPSPALDRPPRRGAGGGGAGLRGKGEGRLCTRTHACGDPRTRPLGAGEGARGPEPKAEELALRHGACDAGGERRLHKEKQPWSG